MITTIKSSVNHPGRIKSKLVNSQIEVIRIIKSNFVPKEDKSMFLICTCVYLSITHYHLTTITQRIQGREK